MSDLTDDWALILGSSSGFGEATSRELASRGMNVVGVHFDRRNEMDRINGIVEDLRDEGAKAVFFNKNAARESTRETVIEELEDRMEPGESLRVLMHSIAFGTLLRYFSDDEETIDPKQMDMTLDVMANSLVYWTQAAVEAGLMEEGGRIFAMTSAGSHRAWPYYGAVSAAKASLEAHVRQLAVELAERGITANSIQAGVTDTAALREIPGHDDLAERARKDNPSGRMTTPEDVARLIALMSRSESQFVTGNVIRCDGGEDIA